MSQLGDLGSGAGKGGGGGGSIREAGGAFGRMEAAREEEFFYKKVRNLLIVLFGFLSFVMVWPLSYLLSIRLSMYSQSQEQLHRMKENQIDQQHWHESQIREHELAISRHQEFLKKLKN